MTTSTSVKELTADGLLFDLDGTLIHTLKCTENVYTWFSNKHGVDPKTVYHACHGVPTLKVLQTFFPKEVQNIETVNMLEGMAVEDYDSIFPIPGALELLGSLPPNKWTIVTSGTRMLATKRLEYLKFPQSQSDMITGDEVFNGKPDPEPFNRGAANLGLDPSKCVVFEDALAGIKSGKAAGSIVVALTTGFSEEELRSAGADYVIRDMTQVHVDVDSVSGKLLLRLES
ncbi:hypothetical protein H4219_002992 [Mycoemilia scoparia]|uniref:Uncharacterized protein n=1 Tax=Mycoemilia scoparia TaxID=417184 RepID=A0A9W7ZW26_9FUNG|nr:hypothetical protein H4219_002992 [Mycoemilia scoparia]